MVCGTSSSGINETGSPCDMSKVPLFAPAWAFEFLPPKTRAGRRSPPPLEEAKFAGVSSMLWALSAAKPGFKANGLAPNFPALKIQFSPHFAPGKMYSCGISVAVHKGLGVIVVILGAMVPKVMTFPAGDALGYRGGAAPEERGAPKKSAGPVGNRPPEETTKPDGRGPSTVTVSVWFDVLVTNLVTMTVDRPGVIVTNPEQSLRPVGLNRGD